MVHSTLSSLYFYYSFFLCNIPTVSPPPPQPENSPSLPPAPSALFRSISWLRAERRVSQTTAICNQSESGQPLPLSIGRWSCPPSTCTTTPGLANGPPSTIFSRHARRLHQPLSEACTAIDFMATPLSMLLKTFFCLFIYLFFCFLFV